MAPGKTLDSLDVGTLKRKTVGGAVSFFIRTLVLNGVGLVAALILGGLLSEADFGIYAVVVNIIGVLTFFSDIGLASALIQRKKPPTEADYHTIFWAQLGLAGLIVAVCFGIVQTGIFADQLGEAGAEILFALAWSFVVGTLKTVPSIKLTRELNFSKFVVPQILEQVVFNGLLIGLVMTGFGLRSYQIAIWGRTLVGTVAMLCLVPFWPRFQFVASSLAHTLKYGLKFQANDFLARLKDQLFYLFVAKQMSIDHFGLIGFAKNWSMYPYNLTVQNVMAITFPTFSRLQEHRQHLTRAVEKSIYFITLAIFPLLTGMCLFFYPLTQVIEKYHKWEPALISFVCFTLAIAPAAISSPLTNVLNATGKINQTLKLMLMWTILTWGLTFPLLQVMGYHAVAVSSLLISLTSVATVWLAKKVVAFKLWAQIWSQTVACGAMALVSLPLMSVWVRGISYTIGGGILAALVYVVAMWLLDRRKLMTEIRSLR